MNERSLKRRLETAFDSIPPCSTCGSKEVDCLGGGSIGKYAYLCTSCSKQWQQIPPKDLPLFGDPEEEPIQRALPGQRKRSNGYKCKKCGQKKKTPEGRPHTCLGIMTPTFPKQCSIIGDGITEVLSTPCADLDKNIFDSLSDCLI
jgi:DNA-directed RNA polymerase subunit RPC12/RpoP